MYNVAENGGFYAASEDDVQRKRAIDDQTDDALDELSGQPRGGGTDQLLIDRIPEQRRSLPVFQILLLYLFKGEKQMKI